MVDWSKTPDAKRATVNARFRVRPELNDLVRAAAAEQHDTATEVACALLEMGAAQGPEALAEHLRRRREAAPEKK